jgi:hypothetical protein
MTKPLTSRDWETLSAYLDGQLSNQESARLAERLRAEPGLAQELETLRRTRAALRAAPRLRARRNFTLTPQMAGERARKTPAAQWFPVMRLASALATFFFIFALAGDWFFAARMMQPEELVAAPAAAPAPALRQEVAAETEPAAEAEAAQAMPAEPTEPSFFSPAVGAAEKNVPGVGGGGGGGGEGEEVVMESAAVVSATLAQEAPLSETLTMAESPPPAEADAPAEEALTMEQPADVATDAARASQEAPAQPFWNGWRVLAGLMAVIAVSAGFLAFILYQASKA